jgi:hypothetical protein
VPADPLSFFPRGRHFVLCALGDDFAFELREGQKDVQGEAAEGTGRVELLRDRHEADAMPVEQLHHLREIQQRAAEAVDLVDHHAIDLLGFDCGIEPL